MKALITGGAGFIGSHLAEFLLARGDSVVVIDDLSTGAVENIRHLEAQPRFRYRIDSVTNSPVVAELVDHCDVVFHLAAAVGVKLIVERPVQTISTNIAGTGTILELAAKNQRKVVFTSSSEVYGKRLDAPFGEDDDIILGPPTKRRWSYACSKAVDEFLAMSYWQQHQLPVVITRLFNTVGPRQTGRYGMVIPRFAGQALAGEPVTVHGDGQQTRCFAYVGDVVRILAALADSPQAVGEIVNVGSDQEITIAALAEQIRVLTNSRSEIAFVPYEVAYGPDFEDMRRRVPDLRKLDRLLSDRPRTDLAQILRKVIDHAHAHGRAAPPRTTLPAHPDRRGTRADVS